MTKLDFKSAAIGFLSATTLVACVAATSSGSQVGRYEYIAGYGDSWNCLDTKTGLIYFTDMADSGMTPAALAQMDPEEREGWGVH